MITCWILRIQYGGSFTLDVWYVNCGFYSKH